MSDWKPTYRHKKRGDEYMLLGIGKMQTATWGEPSVGYNINGGYEYNESIDMREVAIYVGKDGEMWVRPREEFEDGRFEVIK